MATEVDRLVTAADGMLVLCSAHDTFKRRRWKGKGEGEEILGLHVLHSFAFCFFLFFFFVSLVSCARLLL